MQTVAKSKTNLKLCRCIHCPNYDLGCKIRSMPKNILGLAEGLNKQKHFEGLFCAFEKSNCITGNSQCVCAECPVFAKYGLSRHYYCRHTAGEQSV